MLHANRLTGHMAKGALPTLLALVCLGIAGPTSAQGPSKRNFAVLAIQGAKIVVRPGEVIEGATILIRNGLIAEVGSDVELPYDAEVIDAEGLTAYAGFIDASSSLGLPKQLDEQRASTSGDDIEIDITRGAKAATREVNRKGIHPDYALVRGFEFVAKTTKPWREAGFTTVHATPGQALLGGRSAVLLLLDEADAPRRDAVVRPEAAMIAGWRSGGSGYPRSLMGSIAHLRQTFLDAQRHQSVGELYAKTKGKSERPAHDEALDSLGPVLSGELPIVFPASSRDEIYRALALAGEFELKPMIEGGAEAYKTIERLKKNKVPVLLRIDLSEKPKPGSGNLARLRNAAAQFGAEVTKEMEAAARKADREVKVPEARGAHEDKVRKWEERAANAGALEEAGVSFAISTRGNKDAKQFKKNLKLVLEAGLSPEAALEALTVAPARILGLENLLGTIEVGKLANIALFDGDFDDAKSKAKITIVGGIKYEAAEEEKKPEKEVAGRGGGGETEATEEESELEEEDKEGEEDEDEEDDDEQKGLTDRPTETDADRVPTTVTGGDVLIKNATVLTMTSGVLDRASILVRDGVIVEIARRIQPPRGVTVIDATAAWVMPGIVDCHSHMATSGGVNEGTDSITAQCRIEDVVRGDDLTLYRAAAGGVTTANLLHGSANAIGGQRAIIQMKYNRPAEEIFFSSYPRGIKFALGENVTRSQSRFPNTRMGVEAVMRRAFNEALQYQRKLDEYEGLSRRAKRRTAPPRRDLRLEALAGILSGEILVHCHSYNADEIAMVLNVLTDFGVKHLTLEHALEAYKVAPEVAAFGDEGAFVSTFADNWAYKVEAYDAIPYNVALINEATGSNAILNSDSGERVRRLYLDAAKMVRFGGLSYEHALRTITYNPARALGIAEQVGSIEVGKRADLALFNGHPLNTYSRPFMTFIGGEVVFERKGKRGGPYPLEAKRAIRKREVPTNPRGLYAITNAQIHPVSSEPIERGTIVIRDGRIAAVGAQIAIPPNATVIDAQGLQVYPGLIDAGSTVGLNEIGSLSVTRDSAETGVMQPDLRAAVAIKPDSEIIPVTRFTGITSAVARPSGGLIAGQSALIQLAGWTPKEMAYVEKLALEINLPRGAGGFDIRSLFAARPGGQRSRGPSAEEQLKRIKELFDEAREYARMKTEADRQGVEFTLYRHDLEALGPYVAKEKPVIINTSGAADILAAIELAEELDVKAILRGGADGWKVAEEIAESGLPMILGPVTRMPRDEYDPYDSAYANPAVLYEAGVDFCFESASGSDSRNLPLQAGMAVAFGLPRAAALRAVTLNAAKILGVEDRVGSLEVGKRADIIVVDRDPLQATSNVFYIFIAGEPVDPDDNKHTRLYRKYQQRIVRMRARELPGS